MKLGGWWRIWVVASVLLGAFVLLVSADTNDIYNYAQSPTRAEAETYARSESIRLCGAPGYGSVSPKYDNSAFEATVACRSSGLIARTFLFAFFPALILATIGLTLRWIIRGFRRP